MKTVGIHRNIIFESEKNTLPLDHQPSRGRQTQLKIFHLKSSSPSTDECMILILFMTPFSCPLSLFLYLTISLLSQVRAFDDKHSAHLMVFASAGLSNGCHFSPPSSKWRFTATLICQTIQFHLFFEFLREIAHFNQ